MFLHLHSLLASALMGQLPEYVLYPRLGLLILGAILSVVYRLFKPVIPDIIGTGVMTPIFEEVLFKIGLLDLLLLRILGVQAVPAFCITTVLFVMLHPVLVKDTSVIGRLLRVVDASYIGIMTASFFLMTFPHNGSQILFAIIVCIAIHMAFNLVIILVRLVFWLSILFVIVRIALCLLYIWQAITFMGDWRAVLVPFFLRGVL